MKTLELGIEYLESAIVTDYEDRFDLKIQNILIPNTTKVLDIREYQVHLLTDNYSIETVRIRRIVTLSNEDYDFFTSHLLCEYSFLQDVGGHEKGIRQVTFVSNSETREGIYVDGFFGYARYVGFTNKNI